VFGKLELEVMRAFSTKYALALYEALARRVRLTAVFAETFPLGAFRELLGVPPGKLGTYSNLLLKAIASRRSPRSTRSPPSAAGSSR
jgi:hypothetical protein